VVGVSAAPSIGCAQPTDIGNKASAHCTADYIFHKAFKLK
jgi:hypothetical protein